MKTISLTVDDETLRDALEMASRRDITLDQLVCEKLREASNQTTTQTEARKAMLAMIGTFGGEVGTMPTREERNARG